MAAQPDAEAPEAESADAEPAQRSEGEPQPSAGSNLERHDPEYLDRDKLDFDPDEGLYSGTAVDGTSDIPGPHADGTANDADTENTASGSDGSGVDAGDGTGADGTGEGR